MNKPSGIGRGNAYFDPFAFADPRVRLGTTQFGFGTAGWNLLRGPGIAGWDFGLFRQFRITERVNLQFCAESFNFTNTPKFNNPGGNVSSLQLNADGTIRNLNGFTEVTGTRADVRTHFQNRVRQPSQSRTAEKWPAEK